MPPLFAPVHEIARQIQIINAYTREAEMLRDPLHDTLWDLLDELIDVHTNLSPKSLFSGMKNLLFVTHQLLSHNSIHVNNISYHKISV
jgi:hypothetical protein